MENKERSEQNLDAFQRLKTDLPFIVNVINDYTDGAINEYLKQLEQAIICVDKDVILYCLETVKTWYEQSKNEIRSNNYVHNFTEHIRVMEMVESYCKELQEFDFGTVHTTSGDTNGRTDPLIFLSHRSTDKKYGDALEKLLTGLGVANDQLIYTSHPLHKIPLDENIYDYLRKNINRNVYMIILWSNDYLESPACMNELGAAWVTQCDYTSLYVPDFEFGNPKYHECALDNRKMGAVLKPDAHCKQSMITLKDKVQELFGLVNDEATVTFLLDQFIDDIRGEQ